MHHQLYHSDYCVGILKEQIDYLAPVVLMPGEDEMGSLAYNADILSARNIRSFVRKTPNPYPNKSRLYLLLQITEAAPATRINDETSFQLSVHFGEYKCAVICFYCEFLFCFRISGAVR